MIPLAIILSSSQSYDTLTLFSCQDNHFHPQIKADRSRKGRAAGSPRRNAHLDAAAGNRKPLIPSPPVPPRTWQTAHPGPDAPPRSLGRAPGFIDQTVGNHLPEIFGLLVIAHVALLAQEILDLFPAVVAGRDHQLGAAGLDLSRFKLPMFQAFGFVGHHLHAAAVAAAIVVQGIVAHLHRVGAALRRQPADQFSIIIAKGRLRFTDIIAGIMDGGQHGMDRGINLDPALVKIFLEQIKHAQDPKFLKHFRKPMGEPEPGCIIGMASFRV